jgi:voltage-gated potassium channel
VGDGRRLIAPIAIFVMLVALGTLGYVLIEGWSFLDAVYMTVITLTTVGYGETHPLSTAGRVFTLGLMVLGIGGALYGFTAIMQFVFEGHLGRNLERRRMLRRIEQLQRHILLCGYGRVGRQVARDFLESKVPFVVIDARQETLNEAAEEGCLTVRGDAADDETLRRAGIERARGLITCVTSDADNIFVTLSARALRADLLIVARGNNDDAAPKLRRAGADWVVSPYSIGGHQMAMLAVRPTSVELVERVSGHLEVDLLVEEVKVQAGSALVGKTVRDIGQQVAPGVRILVIRRDTQLLTRPPLDAQLAAGDELVAFGTSGQLKALEVAS